MYAVKDIFYSIQGEGMNAGRPAVFVRFAGCNQWSGRDEDRGKGGSCSAWCDTDFVGGREFAGAAALVKAWCSVPLPVQVWAMPRDTAETA